MIMQVMTVFVGTNTKAPRGSLRRVDQSATPSLLWQRRSFQPDFRTIGSTWLHILALVSCLLIGSSLQVSTSASKQSAAVWRQWTSTSRELSLLWETATGLSVSSGFRLVRRRYVSPSVTRVHHMSSCDVTNFLDKSYYCELLLVVFLFCV